MKLYVHFCANGFSNCYILEDKQKAVIIDPGSMDEAILNIIEDNSYTLAGILITHGHLTHLRAVNTIKRIYETEIYCISPVIQGFKTITLRDGETVNLGSISIEVIAAPGHSADSAIYRIGRMLFTGDAITAGLIGRTPSVYAASNQMTAIRGKILSLPGDYSIFPGHGPPTTLETERRFNAGINAFEDYKARRPVFKPRLG